MFRFGDRVDSQRLDCGAGLLIVEGGEARRSRGRPAGLDAGGRTRSALRTDRSKRGDLGEGLLRLVGMIGRLDRIVGHLLLEEHPLFEGRGRRRARGCACLYDDESVTP